MADQDLKFIISAVDKATAEFKRITAELEKVGKTSDDTNKKIEDGSKRAALTLTDLYSATKLIGQGFSILSTAVQLPITAFTSLFDVSSNLVREYDRQAQAEVKLTSALKSQGDVTKETVTNLKAYASALQQTTRFGDEAIVEVEALIAGFVRGEDDIKRATAATLDFAAAFGVDLQTAALKVAQAFETGSIKVGRISIQLSEAQNPAARLGEVLGGLERRFGGIAAAVAVVGAGPLDQLSNAYSDLAETLGELIGRSPEFLAFIDTSKELLTSFQEFAKNNSSDLIIGFGRVFSTSMKLMSGSVLLLVDAVASMTSVAQAIGEWLQVFDTAAEVNDKIAATKAEIVALEVVAARQRADNKSFFGEDFFEPPGLTSTTGALNAAYVQLEKLEAKLKSIEGDPFTDMKKGVGELAGELDKLIEQFDAGFERNLEARRADTPEAEQARKAASFERATQNVEAAGLTGDLDPVVIAQKAAAELLSKSAIELSSTAAIAAQLRSDESFKFLNALTDFDGSVAEWEKLRALEQTILDQFDAAIEALGLTVDDLASSALDLTLSAGGLNFSSSALNASASSLDASATDLSLASGDLSGSAGSMDRAADALQGAADSLGGLGGGEKFAVGGIVQRPTRAIIGESGPEVVIPLNADGAAFAARALGLGEGPGGGMSIRISANNLTLSDKGLDAVFSQFDRKLADSLSRQQRLKSGSL